MNESITRMPNTHVVNLVFSTLQQMPCVYALTINMGVDAEAATIEVGLNDMHGRAVEFSIYGSATEDEHDRNVLEIAYKPRMGELNEYELEDSHRYRLTRYRWDEFSDEQLVTIVCNETAGLAADRRMLYLPSDLAIVSGS